MAGPINKEDELAPSGVLAKRRSKAKRIENKLANEDLGRPRTEAVIAKERE